MTRTIYLLVAYDGTDFHGWQLQPGLRTVQGVIEEAVRRVVRHPVDVHGSGRTDAGVHAVRHASHFLTTCPVAGGRLRQALGSRLPPDVSLVALLEVPPDFHARRSAVSKLYRYRVHNALSRPIDRGTQRYVYHCRYALDVKRMQAAAEHFLGERDFAAMAPVSLTRESTVRTVFRCDVERHLDEVRIHIEGSGFLYKQVRTMAGTLVNVGRGLWAPDRVAAILSSGDRTKAGPTLPAQGLCLQWVRYPPQLLKPPPGVDTDETIPDALAAR